jgi:hypothetical protein
MFPVAFPDLTWLTYVKEIAILQEKVSILEYEAQLMRAAFQELLERHEARFGKEVKGNPLAALEFETTKGLTTAATLIKDVEERLAENKPEVAARVYREATGVTWDEAHTAVGDWHLTNREHKLARITRLVRLREFSKSSET